MRSWREINNLKGREVTQGRSQDFSKGVPKSLGNKGVASWGVQDSATSARMLYSSAI